VQGYSEHVRLGCLITSAWVVADVMTERLFTAPGLTVSVLTSVLALRPKKQITELCWQELTAPAGLPMPLIQACPTDER